MPLEEPPQLGGPVGVDRPGGDELRGQPPRQLPFGVVDVRAAAGHARADVAPERPEHDDGAVRHVLAGVVADALDDRDRARVANGEALAGTAGAVELAARGAVEDGVADEHRLALVAVGRPDRDTAAAHRLADVVVRLARELERDSVAEERAEALTG